MAVTNEISALSYEVSTDKVQEHTREYGSTEMMKNDNRCFSSPCKHGGTCIEEQNGYSCFCSAEFRGFHCDIGSCTFIVK